MYAKLFSSIYQGTLRGNTHGLVVFTNMLAHADKEGWVDIHPRSIAEEVGLTVEQVNASINELESPDLESRSPEEDGRRIVRIDEHRVWGWRIVNYKKYSLIKNEEDRREQNRLAQERWRNKHKPPVSNSKQPSAESAHIAVDVSVDVIDPIANSVPRCPVDKIVDLYHQVLPELPKVMALTVKRKSSIKQRWDQLKPESTEDGVESFTDYFKLVRGSDFLMGKKPASNGHKVFVANLEWLVNESNFIKVCERNYHERV